MENISIYYPEDKIYLNYNIIYFVKGKVPVLIRKNSSLIK